MTKKASIKVCDQIVRPKIEGGVEYVGERLVLARHGALELWWARGGNCWSSLGEQSYYPAELQVVDCSARHHYAATLHEGGRLSMRLLRDNAKKIDDFFGVKVSASLHPKKTVVIEWTGDVDTLIRRARRLAGSGRSRPRRRWRRANRARRR